MYGRYVAGPPHRDGEQLKNQVAALTTEVVRLWRAYADLASEPGVKDAMTSGLEQANKRARRIAEEMDAPSLDWLSADPFAAWGTRKWWPVP